MGFNIQAELEKSAYRYADKAALLDSAAIDLNQSSPHQRLASCVASLQARFSEVNYLATDLLFLVNLRSCLDYRRMLPWLSVHDDLWCQAAERLGHLRVCPIEYNNTSVGQIVAFTWTVEMILGNLRSAKKEALAQLAAVVEQCDSLPSVIGMGAAVPSLIEKDLYLRFKDSGATLVSGHHSTVLATIEILKQVSSHELSSIAILGVGKIGRSAAIAVAEEFSRYGLKKLLLVDPKFRVPPRFMERLLAFGIEVEAITHYGELKEADAILGFPSAVDFPLDRYLLQGGKLRRGAVIINDAQPPCLSWSVATELWNKGVRTYSVATSQPDVETNICFETHIGGYNSHCFYACLSEVIAVYHQRCRGRKIDSLVGDVDIEMLAEVKQWHQEAGIGYPLIPYGRVSDGFHANSVDAYVQLEEGVDYRQLSEDAQMLMSTTV